MRWVVAAGVRRRALAGALAAVAALLGAAGSAPAAFASAGGAEAPLPANAAANPGVSLAQVACPSAGNCTAVGFYTDTSGRRQGLLLGESSGSWARGVEAPLPANAAAHPGVYLYSVACASAGNCTAVGSYLDTSGARRGLLLGESSGSWAPGVEAPLPANAAANPDVKVDSVSCASAGNCIAVGDYFDTSGDERGLLLAESSGSWAPGVEAPLPGNAAANPFVVIGSVSCASAGNCTAVGRYTDRSHTDRGLLLSESSGSWAPGVEAPLPTNAAGNPEVKVGSVSCASAGNCTALGGYADTSSNAQGLLLSESSGSWAPAVEAPLPTNAAADPGVGLAAVSCVSAGNCTAVGFYIADQGTHVIARGLLLGESSGAWARGVEAPLPVNATADPAASPGVLLGSVSCAAAGSCIAVGSYSDTSRSERGLLLSESSGSWARGFEALLPANAAANPAAGLGSVSCASAGNCTAAGSYTDSSGHLQGLLETIPGPGTPAISRLRVFPRKVALAGRRVHGRCVKPTRNNHSRRRCRRAIHVKVSYMLNIAATATFTLRQKLPGREVNGRCVRQTKHNKRHNRCGSWVKLRGTITQTAPAGSDSFTFNGKIGGQALGPGVYRLRAIPGANGRLGTPQQAIFEVASSN